MFEPHEWDAIQRYAWRIARHLTPTQRPLFSELLKTGRLDERQLTARGLTRFKARLLALATEAAVSVKRAKAEPVPPFMPGSGLKRYVPS